MSLYDSTSDTFFEKYFTDRLAEMEPYLRNWAKARYNTLDATTRDEAMQRTRIVLWEQYQADPETWAGKPPRAWTQYAKTVYSHSLYDKKERVIKRRFTTESDLVTGAEEGDLSALDLLHSHIHHRHSETRDFHLAELRIDLEIAIRRGLERLDPADRTDMLALMDGIMLGCNLREIGRKHGWCTRRTTQLNKLLRTVFYEELTGHTRREPPKRGTTPDELTLIARLAAQGLGSHRIAAQFGRSPAWAHDHLRRIRQAQRTGSRDDLAQYAVEHLGAVVVEGTDWPHNREGDDLAPVPVAV
jgi:hypothetical protein